jgi:hypothetical protein
LRLAVACAQLATVSRNSTAGTKWLGEYCAAARRALIDVKNMIKYDFRIERPATLNDV